MDRIFFEGQEFRYRKCTSCNSLYCQPMPDARVIARMYGRAYAEAFSDHSESVADPKEPEKVVLWLERLSPGTFVDYGCGDGRLLTEALKLNWRAIGVEYDREVVRRTAEHMRTEVIAVEDLGAVGIQADVLHLGDVIEHLTELDHQMPAILQLVKPGGVLLAQGPLEANKNLFALAVQGMRSLRSSRRTEMAPYHVILATATGQRQFFQRYGLEEIDYSLHEVAWPAPNTLSTRVLMNPRSLAMFLMRRLSKSVSALQPARWGNRYFYAGRKPL